ncbi:4Fe-4S binding protein [Butyricicoccus sp.]
MNPHKCIRCGSCTDTCAFHAISLTTFGYPA